MNNLNNKLNEEAIISIINALVSKEGFNISDAWTWKSAMANGIVSGVMSLVAIYISYRYYKRQERIRINNDLKLKYYSDYEEKLIKVINILEQLIVIEDIESNEHIELNFLIAHIRFTNRFISTDENLIKNLDFNIVHRFIELFENVIKEMVELVVFLEVKKVERKIKSSIYDEEYKELKRIYDKLYKLNHLEYLITNSDLFEEESELEGLDEEETYMDKLDREAKEAEETESYIVSKEVLEKDIEEYTKILEEFNKIIEDKKISKLSESIKKKHDDIGKDILGY